MLESLILFFGIVTITLILFSLFCYVCDKGSNIMCLLIAILICAFITFVYEDYDFVLGIVWRGI